MDQPLGFNAKAPVGEWNKRLGVDYPGVFKAVLKATLAAATANAPGAVSAAIDGFFAFKVEDAKRPPEELAWLLTRRALARAMAELTVEAARRHGTLLDDKDGLVGALDDTLDGAEIWIDPAFFDRPAEHPVVDAVKPRFHEWLGSLGLNDAEAASVNHRFGAYFTFAPGANGRSTKTPTGLSKPNSRSTKTASPGRTSASARGFATPTICSA